MKTVANIHVTIRWGKDLSSTFIHKFKYHLSYEFSAENPGRTTIIKPFQQTQKSES